MLRFFILEQANAQVALMMAVSRAAAARLEISPAPPATPPPHLLHQLEILVCDSSTLK